MMTKRRVLRAISLLAAVFVLSGCVNQKEEERNLAKALEEEYGEEFVVVDSIVTSANWLNAGPLEAVCYPKANRNLTFQAAYSDGQIYYDEYVQAVVREEAYAEMQEILSKKYKDFLLDVNVFQPMIEYSERENYPRFTNISDVSIASYVKKYENKMRLAFYIIFDKTEVKKYDEVREVFEKYSDKFDNAQVNFWCYYSDNNTISELRSEKEKDIWGNFNLRFKTNRSEVPEYLYCRENGIFSLYWIYDAEGLRKYDVNGNEIIESEE